MTTLDRAVNALPAALATGLQELVGSEGVLLLEGAQLEEFRDPYRIPGNCTYGGRTEAGRPHVGRAVAARRCGSGPADPHGTAPYSARSGLAEVGSAPSPGSRRSDPDTPQPARRG